MSEDGVSLEENIESYIRKKVENDKEYTLEERKWILECLIPRVGFLKCKAGAKTMVNIYLQTVKTWKNRKGRVGEVVWG